MAIDRVKADVFFQNLPYPADKSKIRKFAAEHGASDELRHKIRKIESRTYGSADEIGAALERVPEVSGPPPRSII